MKKIVLIFFFINLALLFFLVYLQPVAVVVPHHNVVADIRMKMLKLIKRKRLITKTVIIISPDHFSNDQRSIYFSDRVWEFPSGKQYFDNKLGNLITKGLIKDDNLVPNDHGIYNVAADINIVWPDAKIIPILIGQKMSFDKISGLISDINKACKFDCLLIASVDFSHYLPYRLAHVHDQNSIRALTNMELASPRQIEVDSPQSIYTLIKFAGNTGARYFNLYDHTNSAELVGSSDAESTSHVFGWYERKLFGKIQNYQVKTFTLADNLSEKDNISSLGERFFYGVDEFNLTDKEVDDKFIIAGYETGNKIYKVYLPITCNKNVCVFARGETKKMMLQQLPQGVDNESGEVVTVKN